MTRIPRSSRALTRRSVIGGSAALAATALAGCAGTGEDSAQGGDAKKLQFWSNHPGTSKSIEQELIKNFEKQSDGISVTLVDGGATYEDTQQKFNAALSGGDLPDLVVVSDVTWFNFALNKQITPLEDLFEKADVDPGAYVKPLYDDYLFQDKHYALPYSRSTPLFYYNKDAWEKAGLEDRGPKDYDELREWADVLKEKAGLDLSFTTGDGVGYLGWVGQGMFWAMGGAYSDEYTPTFTGDGALKAAAWLQDFKKSGLYDVSKDPATVFGSGQSAACIESTGSLSGILESAKGKFEVGTAFLPGPEGDACPTGGAGVAIPAGISDERKVNALKALGFLTNAESTATFSQGTGYMPVQTAAVDSDSMKSYLKKTPQAKTALDQLPTTKPQDYARVFVAGGDQQIGGSFDKIVGGDSVEKTLEALQSWMEPKLEQLAQKAK
ncbi:ABC transporter substrate-binding protein [Brachybacterium sp. ACRRE]|uniref:ABC transporter substrate-binding protein n=1 Tax=Brachybacterium sp. ACRRE TaxID=2918184 RepID=UPI001EF2030E|nr:ABC transporter substrate-binding protein [Brachybacterium sp. ACRRE]MCG7308834.1 ABC transporter substrate-binding protein [Brachybacterium sp. ACRRE]